ncbi:hypothetical protein [Kouleothrix sp.]|uniref:hypothetical protein n=1 Tax=Kouleothrix sp. TaxID=2779161 RepID=UPI00391C3253
MKKTKVKVVVGQKPWDSHVYINDAEVPVLAVDVRIRPDELTTARIELIADEVILQGEFLERSKKRSPRPVPPTPQPPRPVDRPGILSRLVRKQK